MRILLAGLLSLICLSGCGLHGDTMATGGGIGVLAGAGTGAIVGSVIANGDVAASALLGGAVGLPVGLIVAGIYDYHSERSVRERKVDEIKENQAQIFAKQREIDAIREELRNEAPTGLPDESLKEHEYTGPTIGNYYR